MEIWQFVALILVDNNDESSPLLNLNATENFTLFSFVTIPLGGTNVEDENRGGQFQLSDDKNEATVESFGEDESKTQYYCLTSVGNKVCSTVFGNLLVKSMIFP